MKRRIISSIIITALLASSLTGCGKDALQSEIKDFQSNSQSIHISLDAECDTESRNSIEWIELDQLNSFRDIRKIWDDELQIVKFDNNSKNGVLYVDLDGNWAGNNTLYNVFQNKKFMNDYWSVGKLHSTLAQPAIDEFSDIDNESTGIYASINTYFNLMPTNVDGTSGLTDNITRAEAMSAIVRGDSQVVYQDVDEQFVKTVGNSNYNNCAYMIADQSYLDYKNGSLCYDTYNSAITRAEVLYMIVNRYWADEYKSINAADGSFSDCTNAGNIADKLGFSKGYGSQAYELEYCLQTGAGCPEQLYKALIVARNHGLINNETKWDQPLMGGTLLYYMTSAYENIYNTNGPAVNAKLGENVGQSLLEAEAEPEPEVIEEVTIGEVAEAKVRDVTNIDELIRVYGSELDMTEDEIAEAKEIAQDWTFSPADQWMEVAYCNWLNVRKGPSTDYKILSSVPSGTKCHVVGVCNENGWYRIIANGKIVYQCGIYFKDFENSENYVDN